MYSIMNSRQVRLLAAAVFSVLVSVAYAADQNNPDPDMMAEKVLHMEIKDQQGKDIGEIKNVLFDRKGKNKEYLVDVGGFLGIGDKTVGVSPDELTYNADEEYAVFNGTKSQLENKQEVDYSSYGYKGGYYPYRTYPGYMYGPRYAYDPYFDGRYPPQGYAGDYGRGYGYDRNDGRFMDHRQNRTGNRQSQPSDQYQDRDQRSQGYGRGYYPADRPNGNDFNRSDISLEAILDADVRTQNGEDVGEIENLVINRRGRITHTIIDVGGFLGIGEKQVAVPFKKLKNIGPYYVMFPGTEAQLESMPAYNRGQPLGSERNKAQTTKQKNEPSASQESQQPAGENQKKNQ
ncbi:MAG: PRC-barrel domain-containing protein [Desulfobacterales bacterium]